MKKNIFVLALSLTFATAAHAETTIDWTQAGCESVGGTWITAHSATDEGCDAAHCNGLNFCRSAQKMNFFSALIWCKSIGHKLTDVETVCPNGLASGQTCANANNFGNVWTDMPSPSNSNRMVYLSGKNQLMLNHDSGNRNNSASLNAICKE